MPVDRGEPMFPSMRKFAIGMALLSGFVAVSMASAVEPAGTKSVAGVSRERMQQADREFNTGYTLSMQGKLDEAVKHTRTAISLNPDHSAAQFNLGVMLGQKKKMDEAIKHMRIAVRLDPRNVSARYNLAYFLHVTGKKDEAVQQYKEVLRLDPNNASANFNYGIILTERGSKEASAHCRKAVQLNPGLSGPVCKQTL